MYEWPLQSSPDARGGRRDANTEKWGLPGSQKNTGSQLSWVSHSPDFSFNLQPFSARPRAVIQGRRVRGPCSGPVEEVEGLQAPVGCCLRGVRAASPWAAGFYLFGIRSP